LSHESPRDAVGRLQADLKHFQKESRLERVIVVNLASTEPATNYVDLPPRWKDLDPLLDEGPASPLSASSLYAIAALDLGMPYINFTPSPGATPPAIGELAKLRQTCHAGQDGKTGETLLKSVLAPMFAARNLEVMSWVGHNIFGNMDGQVLDDPVNKSAKIQGKDKLLGHILGYDPQTLVTIEYIRSLGDWKTAWDHIHFRGFLGTPMTMQFTWQGCDSLLAAPLVLDLVRFVELSNRRGETGLLSHLGSFFKRPLGLDNHAFDHQSALLEAWATKPSR
jgi:myo-inositol-1-phosphate synthase